MEGQVVKSGEQGGGDTRELCGGMVLGKKGGKGVVFISGVLDWADGWAKKGRAGVMVVLWIGLVVGL